MTIDERNQGRADAMDGMICPHCRKKIKISESKNESEKNPYQISQWQKGCSWGIEGYRLLTDEQYNDIMKWRNDNLEHYDKYEVKRISLKKYNNNPDKQLDGSYVG